MKFDVVTFGSAFIDVFLESSDFQIVKTDKVKGGVALCEVYGGKIGVKNLTITTGGGATNNAVGFERLGLQTAAVCCVGDDDWGLFIRKNLQSEGVSPLYVQIDKQTQTSYATALVADDGSRTLLVYRGASNSLSWAKVAWGKLHARWFHVSSLGGDLALLTKIIRTAQARKIEVSLNPGNGELQAKEKLRAFLPHVHTLLLNQMEAERFLGVKGESAVEAKLKTLGPKIVVVTRGPKGAVVWQEGGSLLRIGIYPVKRREETGAGDAFGTGFVGGLLLGHDTETALKMGTANASSVVTQVGAKAGLLFGPELNDWLKKPLRGAS
jgi:sugar/nucleoside kinase (ribokinase family)